MPGIVGIIASKPDCDGSLEHALRAMVRAMEHRPTYKSHIYVGPRVAMGRTGPGFLNPEKQPVFNEDGSIGAVFDGELFEPVAMAARLEQAGHNLGGRSDAEIALHAFEAFGNRGIADLPGAYVGFIYDSQRHMGNLFTDRLGLRGCYYTVMTDGTFAFASEMKAIAALPGFQGQLDLQAAAEFLNCSFPFFDRTFFGEVKFLPYGTVLQVANSRAVPVQYWDFPQTVPESHWTFEDAVDEGVALLLRAVSRQFRQKGRIGVMLSGGLDSRAIAAAATSLGHCVRSFSLGWGNNAEQRLAARVAERLGMDYLPLDIPPDYPVDVGAQGAWYADGMHPCSLMPWMPQTHRLATEADALLSGYLGGVFLGGVFLKNDHLSALPLTVQKERLACGLVGTMSPFLSMALRRTFLEPLKNALRATYHQVLAFPGERGFANELERLYLATDERRLTNAGNAAMLGTAADLKYPFGDYELLDLYSRLPVPWRINCRLYKAILCRAFPNLVDIPCYSANTQFLPTRLNSQSSVLRLRWHRAMREFRFILGRLTHGRISLRDPFDCTNYTHWYRTVPRLRHWVQSVLLDERTLARGYFDREGIQRLLRINMTRGYVFTTLATLITFEYWNRFFVDRLPWEEANAHDHGTAAVW